MCKKSKRQDSRDPVQDRLSRNVGIVRHLRVFILTIFLEFSNAITPTCMTTTVSVSVLALRKLIIFCMIILSFVIVIVSKMVTDDKQPSKLNGLIRFVNYI